MRRAGRRCGGCLTGSPELISACGGDVARHPR